MSKIHQVEQGDGIDSIAFRYGFEPTALWQHSLNEALRKERPDGNVLLPGDEVQIPDLEEKRVVCATNKRHIMKRKGVPSKFRLQLFDNRVPRAHQAWRLDVEGRKYEGQTDGAGIFEIFINPLAGKGTLVIGPDEFTVQLKFGELDPHSATSGWEERLKNLNLLQLDGPVEQEWIAENALRAFQYMMDLEITGEPDEATLAALDKLHGSSELMPRNSAGEVNNADT